MLRSRLSSCGPLQREARVKLVSVKEDGYWRDMGLDEFKARLNRARRWWFPGTDGSEEAEANWRWWGMATEAQKRKATERYWDLEDLAWLLECIFDKSQNIV